MDSRIRTPHRSTHTSGGGSSDGTAEPAPINAFPREPVLSRHRNAGDSRKALTRRHLLKLSLRTRRSGGRAAALLRLAAVTVGRTDTALGAFYRRLSARIGKAKAVTATARKVAVLFYNAVRHGMEYVDPGASAYETRYRARIVNNLHRRAKAFGFVLQPM